MKGLNKIALVAAIAAASTAQAELVAMDDAAMSAATGQAGLTIDIDSASISIGEIAYEDAGLIGITNLSITGAHGAALDDIRMFVDVSGGASDLGGAGALGADYLGALGATDTTGISAIAVDDGDLIIAIRGQNGVVDYGLNIAAVDLAASTVAPGAINGSADTTTLVSDLRLNGLLGPIDMVIHNDGGTSETMEISAYFNVEDLSGGADAGANSLNLDFMNTNLKLRVHNSRGAEQLTVAGTSFAHVGMSIGQANGVVDAAGVARDGLAFNLTDFSGDIDLTDITLGGTPSIGNLYMTDVKVTANMVIYGH